MMHRLSDIVTTETTHIQWRENYFWTGEAKPKTPNWWDLYRIWTAFLCQK